MLRNQKFFWCNYQQKYIIDYLDQDWKFRSEMLVDQGEQRHINYISKSTSWGSYLQFFFFFRGGGCLKTSSKPFSLIGSTQLLLTFSSLYPRGLSPLNVFQVSIEYKMSGTTIMALASSLQGLSPQVFDDEIL